MSQVVGQLPGTGTSNTFPSNLLVSTAKSLGYNVAAKKEGAICNVAFYSIGSQPTLDADWKIGDAGFALGLECEAGKRAREWVERK